MAFKRAAKVTVLTGFMAFSALSLSACGQGPVYFSNKSPQVVASPDKVSSMLADAADRASDALEKLAAVEYAKSPGVAVAPVAGAPRELRRAITVNWVGPVEPITKTLADRASYHFSVVGVEPQNPLVISLDVENMPVIDVLRDIGLQMGSRADIRVDVERRAVELHYPPTSGVEAEYETGMKGAM